MINTYFKAKYYLASVLLFSLLGITRLLAVDSLSLSTTDIDDTIVGGTTVATITGNNASGATVFSMPCTTSGVDDSKFSIGGLGSDELVINEDPDYHTQSSYNICIRAVDDEGTYEENFTLTVSDMTVPEFDSVTVSSNNSNSGAFAKEGDIITFSVNLINPDTSGILNTLTFDLGIDVGNILNLDQNALALNSHTKNYTISAGQSGTLDIIDLVFTDDILNVLSGFTSPYLLTLNIIVDTSAPLISFSDDVSASSNLTDDINIVVSDDYIDPSGLYYGFSFDNICDGTDTYDQAFISGNTFTINDTLNNGKYICVKAFDYAGNVTYLSSLNALNITTAGIDLSGTGINENVGVGYSVGDFSTIPSTGTTFIYDFVVGNGDTDNGSFTISGATLVAQFDPNYEQKSTYNIRISSTDENLTVIEDEFIININDVNLSPTDITLSGSTIDENLAIGTIIGDLTGTDDGEDNGTLTYSMTCSTGGVDDSNFTLSGTNLLSNIIFDYETQNLHNICVRVSDGTLTYDENFVISINDVSETGTDITFSGSLTLAESTESGALLGDFSTVGTNSGATYTYTFATGTGDADNASFTISGSSLYTNFVPNYETKNTYSVLIKSTDNGGLAIEKQFIIVINDENLSPTDITLNGSTIDENLAIGTIIGDLTGTDDGEDNGTLTYSMTCSTGGVDDSNFTLSGTNLLSNIIFDYETQNLHNICVRVSDGTLTYDENFVISINDVSETGTDITFSGSLTLAESTESGALLGDFSTVGTNSGATYTYTFATGTGDADNASFTISGSSLYTNFVPNYETKNTYNIRIGSTDENLTVIEDEFIIIINDVNLAPTDITLSGSTIDENLAIGTIIGDLTGTDDGEDNGTLTYSMTCNTGGVDDSNFTLSGTNLLSNIIFDYETQNLHNICVRVSDGTLTYDENFVISINDVAEIGSDITSNGSLILAENTESGAVIGDFNTIGTNSGATYTYTFATGTGDADNASFTISGSSLYINFVPNYEQKSTYNIRISSTDENLTVIEDEFIIIINDVNLSPTDITLNGSTIDENLAIGTIIGDLTGTDDGEDNGTLTYSMTCSTGGVDDSNFTLSGTNLLSNIIFDYETQNLHNICIRVSDGTLTYDENFVISINDVVETGADITFSGSLTLAENTESGALLGDFSTVGTNSGATYTYTFATGTGDADNASFTISGSSLYTNFVPNYETKNTYSILIRSTDNFGLIIEKQFSIIIINDENLAPTDISISSNIINENLPIGSAVGALATIDPDSSNTYIYTLVAGTGSDNNASFGISGNNLVANFSADYESKNSYSVRLRSIDNGGLFTEKQFIISIGNVSEGSSGGGGGGGGGGGSIKDNCPSGDYSYSYYDRTCGIKPKTGTGITNTGTTQIGSISTGSTTTLEDNIDSILDKTFDDTIYKDDIGDEHIIKKTITGEFIIKKTDGTYEDKVFSDLDKAKKYIDDLIKVDVIYLDDYDFDESINPIIYVSRFEDRFMSRKLTNGKYILYTEKGIKLNGFFNKQYEVLLYLQRVF